MTDLEQQLKDPMQHKEILEKLARFVGLVPADIHHDGTIWVEGKNALGHDGVIPFSPFANALDCEQVEKALLSKGLVLNLREYFYNDDRYAVLSYWYSQDRTMSVEGVGKFAKRFAICDCALKVMEENNDAANE